MEILYLFSVLLVGPSTVTNRQCFAYIVVFVVDFIVYISFTYTHQVNNLLQLDKSRPVDRIAQLPKSQFKKKEIYREVNSI